MENEGAAFATLGVAAEFERTNRQVGAPLLLNLASKQHRNCNPVSLHHKPICCCNARGFVCNWKGEVVIEATEALDNSSAAGNSAKNRNAAARAFGAIYFGCDAVRITQHHKRNMRFPETQGWFAETSFEFVEQGFIACQILRRSAECDIKQANPGHRSASVTAPTCAELTSFAYLARTPRV